LILDPIARSIVAAKPIRTLATLRLPKFLRIPTHITLDGRAPYGAYVSYGAISGNPNEGKMRVMSDKRETGREAEHSNSPIRASFSMTRSSREAIRWVSDRYNVDQSDVVDIAPALFVIMAELCLRQRRETLQQVRVAVEQAQRNLDSVAALSPHLRVAALGLGAALQDMIKGEEKSIANHEIQFVGIGSSKESPLHYVTDFVEDSLLQMVQGAPIISTLRHLAAYAGMMVEQDDLDEGKPAVPSVMLLRLADNYDKTLVVNAHQFAVSVTEENINNIVTGQDISFTQTLA